jgi:hypothetical protein
MHTNHNKIEQENGIPNSELAIVQRNRKKEENKVPSD